jgi:hypothetical protein
MMITKNSNRSVWCDYCKNQYGAHTIKGQNPATWIATSTNGLQRAYCDRCRHSLESWSDGSVWDLRAQQEYRQGKQEINYGF